MGEWILRLSIKQRGGRKVLRKAMGSQEEAGPGKIRSLCVELHCRPEEKQVAGGGFHEKSSFAKRHIFVTPYQHD